jgi:hypothetical protein
VKRIIWSCVALVFGALVIFGAIRELNSDRVECGGETMSQGDVCVSKTRGGRVTESNLEESKTSAKVGAIAGIVIASLIVVIGFQNLKIGIRNRRAAAEEVPSIPWPDLPFPQHQQSPQQHQYSPGPEHQPSPQPYSPSQQALEYQQNQPYQNSPQQGYPQQHYSPQQNQSAQYPPQQHYYQPSQHQYYQPQPPPGHGDAQR